MYFDTHCHLADESYTSDLTAVLDRAVEVGIAGVLVPGTCLGSSLRAAAIAVRYPLLYAAAGIHPEAAGRVSQEEMDGVRKLLTAAEVIAVGETGMDFHYPDGPSPAEQEELFRSHILMADASGLTLVVHSRDAEQRVLGVLCEHSPSVPVVLHCWTGDVSTAKEAVGRGFYIGLAGPVTYPANGRLRELAAALPRERILAETDGPFLSPASHRGRRNEPSFLPETVETIASSWNAPVADAAGTLMENSLRALQLGPDRRTDLVYSLNGRLYMNITGQCGNGCRFCIRELTDGIGGYHLAHNAEPDPDRLRRLVGMLDPSWSEELVFCGYGEPTMRPELLRELAADAASRGFNVRLNTNGLCLERLSKESTLEMLEPFTAVSVSLNASNAREYDELCLPGSDTSFESLLAFVRLAGTVCAVRTTAVRVPGLDISAVRALAADLGVQLRVRG